MFAQRQLNLSINHRSVLVTVEALRIHLGVDADTVYARVDAGELRWVWNVSTGNGSVRELRFWTQEIIRAETTAELKPSAAIAAVLGSERERWQGVEVAQLLMISRPQVKRLHDNDELRGDIVSGKLWVKRTSLEKFLTSRLCNAGEMI